MSKLKRILSALLIPTLLPTVLLTSCGKEGDDMPFDKKTTPFIPQSEGLPADDTFVGSITDFSEELFRLSMEKGKNLVISPLSVTYALTLTANGASGETLAEMNGLNGNIPVDRMNEYLSSLTRGMSETKESTVQIANSVWANKQSFTINEDFRNTALAYYGAEASALDFSKQKSADTINKWVSEHTDGMIDKAVNQLDPMTAMILINTVLFDGKWQVPYHSYNVVKGDFRGYTQTTSNAEFLASTEYSYFEVKDGVGFSKPYKDGYRFVAILPNSDVDVYDFAAGLNLADTMKAAEAGLGKVICRIPKFEYEAEVDLNEILCEMGMKRAFSPEEAELEGLGTSSFGSLYISSVLQKAKIKLDEQGTKAAAMTEVVVNATCAAPTEKPKEIILDRPFVYMILDSSSGLPLFLGILADLKG